MKTFRYALLATLCWPAMVLAQQYVCVPDAMTGFSYNPATKQWTTTRFNTDFKYVLSPAKNGRDAFVLTKVGEREAEGYCRNAFNEAGFLFCSSITSGEFKFNRRNGRYLMVFQEGYYLVGKGMWAATDEDSGTPAMQIGKCTPF